MFFTARFFSNKKISKSMQNLFLRLKCMSETISLSFLFMNLYGKSAYCDQTGRVKPA